MMPRKEKPKRTIKRLALKESQLKERRLIWSRLQRPLLNL